MKKHLLNLLLLIAPMTLMTLNAQTTLEQGTIKMEITEASSEDENTAAMLEMMKGTTTEIFFKGDDNFTRMNMMGGMMKIETKLDKKSNKVDMLMDMMGQKMWIESTQEESAKAKDSDKAIVVSDKSDTKKILGYDAYKVTVQNPDMPEMKMSGYVTEQIEASTNSIQGMEGLDLPGFPLIINILSPQMSLTIETVAISKEVDESVFKIKTEGYKKMTMEEFEKTMGGMGGMGF